SPSRAPSSSPILTRPPVRGCPIPAAEGRVVSNHDPAPIEGATRAPERSPRSVRPSAPGTTGRPSTIHGIVRRSSPGGHHGQEVPQEEGPKEERRQPRQAPQLLTGHGVLGPGGPRPRSTPSALSTRLDPARLGSARPRRRPRRSRSGGAGASEKR